MRSRAQKLLACLLLAATTSLASSSGLRWKAVLLTGDDSIDAFDNARDEVGRRLFLMGVLPENLIDLSYAQSDPNGDPWPASIENLRAALTRLKVGPGDACLVHLTSHGGPEGFFFGDEPALTPEQLDAILDEGCGNQPTIVLISACHSGIFVEPIMRRKNRIVLTAARWDRTSFGCDSESEYTFWDGCLIDSLQGGARWTSIARAIDTCIRFKERREREKPSYPQAFFGHAVRTLAAPDLPATDSPRPDDLFNVLWGSPNACFLPAASSQNSQDSFQDDVCW